jgi:RNA recognition motif-containing protein
MQEPREKQNFDNIPSSRLIVFGIPKYFTEKNLAEHFREKGKITDCRIMRKHDKSRKFAFIGFENEK